MLCCIGATVFDWWLRLTITPHHDVPITTSLMVLCPLSVALCGIELRPLNFGGESLKVRINDETGSCLWWVLKEDFVLTLFRHLHPDCGLPSLSTVGFVGFQQIHPCVAVQAALAEVLALLVLALILEEAFEVLNSGVVKFADLFNQQQITAGHSIRLGPESGNSHALIPTKYIYGQVIQLLHFWDLRDGHRSLASSDHLQ